MGGLFDLAFHAAMAIGGSGAHRRLLAAAKDPRAAQAKTLLAILAANGGTVFGRAHGLADLRGEDAFRASVPIADYEAMRPWIDRQIAGERAVVAEPPLMYARTSGTTAEPKHLPVTATMLSRMKRAQRAMAFAQHRACPLFAGRVLAMAGARREASLAGGVPAGSVTGLIYETMPAAVRRKYVVPPEVFAIEDAELKYQVVTRLALQHGDLTAVSTANPSTLLRLRDVSRAGWNGFLREIADGTCAAADRLPPDLAAAVRDAVFPAPERAKALAKAARTGEPAIGTLWPNLAGVVTWTGGSCALAAETVRKALPAGARLIEAGYVSSEFRGTVVVDAERGLGLPLVEDVFFEFVRADRWDEGVRETLLLHELEPDEDYQVIVTTFGGLYRYWINDVVRAGPAIAGTPSLAFVRKGRGVTSITGEKLTEAQVNAAVAAAARRLGLDVVFHLAVADEAGAAYRLMLELDGDAPPGPFADLVEAGLCASNIEYAAKRGTGRLKPVDLWRLEPGSGAAYRRWCVGRGQRDSQFKVLALQYARECAFDFSGRRRHGKD